MTPFTSADVANTTAEQLTALLVGAPETYAAWIQVAAEMGLIEAQAIYAQMLLDGIWLERNPIEVLERFKRAVHADHVMAINMWWAVAMRTDGEQRGVY